MRIRNYRVTVQTENVAKAAVLGLLVVLMWGIGRLLVYLGHIEPPFEWIVLPDPLMLAFFGFVILSMLTIAIMGAFLVCIVIFETLFSVERLDDSE